ncbi:MAG TPA: RtcB family protein [Kofleriaceae bacterium]|nr:RtcB family protein [Kofleriaceae bacterium]
MNPSDLIQRDDTAWEIPQRDAMRVPVRIYASEILIRDMDDKVREQACNVAALPGIVDAVHVMPDAHWGYGFPIGGVAAFDPDAGGVISAGGVGFDISCGVRCLLTGMRAEELTGLASRLADALYAAIPAGVGSTGRVRMSASDIDDMLTGGARWAIERGYGMHEDLERIEEHGQMLHAKPAAVSDRAKRRQRDEMGTLGSGNHYLEVDRVVEIGAGAEDIAAAFGLRRGDAVVLIHCGSRGLGHQIGTDYLRDMVIAAAGFGIVLPDRELACAPIESELGRSYLGASRAATNCALANRQILTHLTREVFNEVVPASRLRLLFDVSHNTCKVEDHVVDETTRRLFVHRKGATRAFGPGHPDVPDSLRAVGQPVIIGGSMGTASYVLAGMTPERAWSSACHGAGRAMSRHEATRHWRGRTLIDELAQRGVIIRSPSMRGIAEEAPGAYKDVAAVVDAAEAAGLARKVARLEPMIVVKG